ncbi:hypothetical protein [Vreelandella glaciei]|uniref:hypothetical protein n=1 Tax=Vreelandella glaciei TaxID=186761 RepID=UPI003001AD42
MHANRYNSDASMRANSTTVAKAQSLLSIIWLVMAFSVSATAQENHFNSPQVDKQAAQTIITENELQLDIQEQAFAQSRANVALIRQIGDGNSSTINQNLNSQGRANLASIYQYGNFNEAMINQEGSKNTGLIHQNGSRHDAVITQSGHQLEAQINQSGLNSNVTISHSGSGYQGISVEQQAFSGNARPVTVEAY